MAAASRQFDLTRAGIENWVEDGSAAWRPLRSKPECVREQYERLLKGLQEAYSEAALQFAPEESGIPAGKDE